MKQLDKMLMRAKAVSRAKSINPVHIIEDGYCYACKGKCKYEDNEKLQIDDNVVAIMGGLSEDATQMDFSNVPTSTLVKVANMKESEEDG